jgi:hypothetical protein
MQVKFHLLYRHHAAIIFNYFHFSKLLYTPTKIFNLDIQPLHLNGIDNGAYEEHVHMKNAVFWDLRHVALLRTDVSEERTAFIIT